ncbi:hypothetical protein [Ancylobacter oerskovii]|uniref:Uncharacterized protein n=1 Tax=Ancylobacter oerskovii TaxID=459519 RepID=A0ABW4Z2N1_9HYPH|nr:hypothetical protein [Ancylobacter oerskovii]MBS7546274.1 hypothetical protein [Ancylobacter oerskovii]
MSDSRRKTPIMGITTKDSDKWFKVAAHRAARRATRISVARGDEPPHTREHGDPWGAPKDGKAYWPEAPDKFMRK